MSIDKLGMIRESNIVVKITYEKSEIKRAISYYTLRIRNIRTYALIVYPIITILIISLFLASEYKPQSIIEYAPQVVTLIFFGHVFYYRGYQQPVKGYLKYYQKRSGGIYGFSNDGVSFVGEEVQSQYLWSVFKKAYEVPSAFLLMDDNKFILVFPKSCFSDSQSIDQFHDLLLKKFPDFKVY